MQLYTKTQLKQLFVLFEDELNKYKAVLAGKAAGLADEDRRFWLLLQELPSGADTALSYMGMYVNRGPFLGPKSILSKQSI